MQDPDPGGGRQILQTSVRYADTLSLTALNFAIVSPSTPVEDLPAAWSASVCWTWTKVGQSLDSSGGGEIFATLAATSVNDGLGLVDVLYESCSAFMSEQNWALSLPVKWKLLGRRLPTSPGWPDGALLLPDPDPASAAVAASPILSEPFDCAALSPFPFDLSSLVASSDDPPHAAAPTTAKADNNIRARRSMATSPRYRA